MKFIQSNHVNSNLHVISPS